MFWTCSTELPLWLRHKDRDGIQKLKSCKDICVEVEKSCPFHVKESELDTASGNPAFICKGTVFVTYILRHL